MPEEKRMTTRLKELFERPEIFVLAGGMNAMGAKMAEVAGYEAFYMSGGNTSAQIMGLTEGGTSMRDMVDNARRIVNTINIPVFCDMDTGYGDAIQVYDTVKEYIRAGIAGAHLEDQTYPPKSGPRRRCVSIEEMVGKLRAAMDAKLEFDPDFVIVARCDFGGVPGATFEGVMERCLAYKSQANCRRHLPRCPVVGGKRGGHPSNSRAGTAAVHPRQPDPPHFGRTAGSRGRRCLVSGPDHHGRPPGVLGLPARLPGPGHRSHRRVPVKRRPKPVGRGQQRRHTRGPAHSGNGGQVPALEAPDWRYRRRQGLPEKRVPRLFSIEDYVGWPASPPALRPAQSVAGPATA